MVFHLSLFSLPFDQLPLCSSILDVYGGDDGMNTTDIGLTHGSCSMNLPVKREITVTHSRSKYLVNQYITNPWD